MEVRNNKELIQYFVVNKDLIEKYNMSTGKIAAQVSHACQLITLRDQNDEKYQTWLHTAIKKVVLKATENEIVKLHEKLPATILIVDKGFTEIPPDSKTVLGFPIMSREEAHQYVKRFRLL